MTGFDDALARLDTFVEQQMQVLNIPGVSIALTDRDGMIRASTYGYADLAAQTPLTADHLFQIGSVTKTMVGVAAMQSYQSGLLDLHVPVTDYLPWFSVRSDYRPISTFALLSHTAGITAGPDNDPDTGFDMWALRQSVATVSPGEFFWYSSLAYKVLTGLLETVHERRFEEIVREGIFLPLDMAASEPVITHAMRSRVASGYQPFYDDRPHPQGGPLVPSPWAETAGGHTCAACTPEDLAAFLRMLLNYGAGPHGRILSDESFAQMTHPVIDIAGWAEGPAYGLGIVTGSVDGHARVGHGGYQGGHLTSMIGDLDDGIGAVAMVNAMITTPHQFTQYALDLLRAAIQGRELPNIPAPPDPFHVPNAAEYAGRYTSGSCSLTVIAADQRLFLDTGPGSKRIPLEVRTWDHLIGWGPDAFLAHHPDYQLFLLRFGRGAGDAAGPVIDLADGSNWYAGERYAGPTSFDYPARWQAYTGHYRRHHPDLFRTNFRIVLRRGRLAIVGAFPFETELDELEEGLFRIGEDERIPECIRFDTIVDGQALRANLSGADYYRFFTP